MGYAIFISIYDKHCNIPSNTPTMPKYKKKPIEKLETKIKRLLSDKKITQNKNCLKIGRKKLLQYSSRQIKYFKYRYYSTKINNLIEESFDVTIPLSHHNLKLLSNNTINPPFGARKIVDLIKHTANKNIKSITIGARENKLEGNKLSLTASLYETLLKIDKEEGTDKRNRVKNRSIPFLKDKFSLDVKVSESAKDYSLMLEEIITSGEFTQQDIISFSNKLDLGSSNEVVIKTQINKQVKWLIETIEILLEDTSLNTDKAKTFGKDNFGFSKVSVTGPEHLMEKILSTYGQYSLFGVPALLNTDKYVVHSGSLTRSQFDLILINHLGDIEVVELKRSDANILSYDQSRGKFYASKDLSIAISQAERYISAVNRDNDEDYKIEGLKIREYINGLVGDTMFVEAVRPSALIIIGSYKTLCKDYSRLRASTKQKVSINDYNKNCEQAYKELKSSFKNIKILTYSELLEHARTRLELLKEK